MAEAKMIEHKLIVTIVNKGKSSKVVRASQSAGAGGGTILDGHGAAVQLMLGFSVEPEKEIVLTLVEAHKASGVLDAIVKELDLNEPNKGISFVIPLDEVVGIRRE
ncbi:nitrogen regulatory protein PII [Candidatus Gastranaerophilus sp. (ex Termes propinquus)]|nr:nitrogen regulatory protein PII [Candidatus Gastranaerophilus sp. (ex Termes propinquus)]